jgi:hypothetical protein
MQYPGAGSPGLGIAPELGADDPQNRAAADLHLLPTDLAELDAAFQRPPATALSPALNSGAPSHFRGLDRRVFV